MRLRTYLLLAVGAFLVATTGADVFARINISGEPLAAAVREHLYWAAVQFVGTILLLAPFLAVAFTCAFLGERARVRSVLPIFFAAMLTLIYFYFGGYQAAQTALLDERWTAATLSIGLLPFFIGAPVVFAVAGIGALVAKFDQLKSD